MIEIENKNQPIILDYSQTLLKIKSTYSVNNMHLTIELNDNFIRCKCSYFCEIIINVDINNS